MTRIARFRTEEGSVRYGVLGDDDTLRLIDGDQCRRLRVR